MNLKIKKLNSFAYKKSDELNNAKHTNLEYKDLIQKIDFSIKRYDQVHSLDRKIKFFLDVRGIIQVNKINGSYMEFGSYLSFCQIAAARVLGSTDIKNYIGLDTFAGEPTTEIEDEYMAKINKEGSFKSNFEDVRAFVDKCIGDAGKLIKGDFRDPKIIKQLTNYLPISIAVVDCNYHSSLKVVFSFLSKSLEPGSFIFVDDFFLDAYNSYVKDILNETWSNADTQLIDFSIYPPFAKSFLVTKKKK